MSSLVLLLVAVAVADTVRPAPGTLGPKVLIYVDMDGSSGVSKPDQVLYPNPEYFAHRRFITADLNAAIRGLTAAARFRIPVIMVAGDDVLAGQIKEELPNAEYAVVKRATSRAEAALIPQPEVQRAIERAAKAAIEKLATFTPYPVADSYRFGVGYQNVRQADLAGTIPGTTRLDSLTLGFSSKTFPEGIRGCRGAT